MNNKLLQKNIYEKGAGCILIVLLALIFNPFHFWMPSMMVLMILGLILVVFGIFSVYLLQEKTVDEREDHHKMISGRFAFLAGSAVLIIAVIVQEIYGHIDVWVVVALVVMILVKIITRIYSDMNY